jgi:hypothetical protein
MVIPRAERKLDARQAPNADGACWLRDRWAFLLAARASFELPTKGSGISCSLAPSPISYQVQYTRLGPLWQGAEMAG